MRNQCGLWFVVILTSLTVVNPGQALAYQVLVGLNCYRPNLHADPLRAVQLFACDGCSLMPVNSFNEFTPAQWRQIAGTCGKWVTVESHYHYLDDYAYVTRAIGRRPNDCCIYIESREKGVKLPPDTSYNEPGGTILKPARIATYSHERGDVPIGVMTAAYRGGWKTALDEALANPRVSAVTMEYTPDNQFTDMLGDNIAAILAAKKRAYVLVYGGGPVHHVIAMVDRLNRRYSREMASNDLFFVVSNYGNNARDKKGYWFNPYDCSVQANIAVLKTLQNYHGRKASKSYEPPPAPSKSTSDDLVTGAQWRNGKSRATVFRKQRKNVVLLYDSGDGYKVYLGGTFDGKKLDVGCGELSVTGELRDGRLQAKWESNVGPNYAFTFSPE